MFDHRIFLKSVPELPGVYRMLDAGGSVLYVGKAKNLRRRLASYFRRDLATPRIARMVAQIAAIEISVVRSEEEALILERHLIRELQPRYNILFRDDKTYPYLRISAGPFPGIFYYRGPLKRGERYFGPFPNAAAARESIQLVQRLFQLRTCEETVFAHRSRGCLLQQIGRCLAPCVGAVSKEEYGEAVRQAVRFLRGETSALIAELLEAMQEASEALAFEKAARLRDQIRALQLLRQTQAVDSCRDEDVDVFVAELHESGWGVVTWAAVRGGKHLGDRAHGVRLAEESWSAEDLLISFIEQHYGQGEAYLPQRIVVHPYSEALAAWLQRFWRDGAQRTKAEKLDDQSLHRRELPRLQPARNEHERAWIEMARTNARVALEQRRAAVVGAELRAQALFEALGDWLGLSEAPTWIECFDVSHHAGEAPVASRVVWAEGSMQPRRYRRFHLAAEHAGDDCRSIAEAVERSYRAAAEEDAPLPDLILIDGGVGQVRAAAAVLEELGIAARTHLLGVAKGAERRVGEERLVAPDGTERQLASDHPGLHLVQMIRDEAHRFAVAGNRARRLAARKTSALEAIPGIGPKRRRALLATFGSLEAVARATPEELMRVPGISQQLARTLYEALHRQADG